MMKATLIGIIAVVVWSISATTLRVLQEEMGLLRALGAIAIGTGLLSLTNLMLRGKLPGNKAVFSNPLFYGRWICMVSHEVLILSAISLVQKEHLPFVILINYLWPTAVIVSSMIFAGVKITRWLAFLTGSAIVISSLAIEILGPQGLPAGLFANPLDQFAYAMAFVGALAWGLYSAMTKRSGETSGGASVLPLFQLTVAIALLLSFIPQLAVPMHLSSGGVFLLIGYCLASCLAYLSWDHGIRQGSVVILSLCADFVPWLSLGVATLTLGLNVEKTTVAAAILLVVGAMITRYGTLAQKTA